jgi:muconolactone delta-isomerase
LLRKDDPDDPVPFDEYTDLIATGKSVLEERTPGPISWLEDRETEDAEVGTFEHLWPIVEEYATWDVIDDGDALEEYKRLLRTTPWKDCDCTICSEHSIEVAIWRGNNRNRRRGFHNTKRFYEQFESDLPRLLVATPASTGLLTYDDIESFLKTEREQFWAETHDLPVAEVGVAHAEGVSEWFAATPAVTTSTPNMTSLALANECVRYQGLYLYDADGWCDSLDTAQIETSDCSVHVFSDPAELREAVLDRLGYENEFVPNRIVQSGLGDY